MSGYHKILSTNKQEKQKQESTIYKQTDKQKQESTINKQTDKRETGAPTSGETAGEAQP